MDNSIEKKARDITKKASSTFFLPILLFPHKTREAIFIVYAFARTADNYIDSFPPQTKQYLLLKKETYRAMEGKQTKNKLVQRFVDIAQTYSFKKEWIDAFFSSLEQDLNTQSYKTYKDLDQFVYGVAEVVGLFMARIFHLSKKAYKAAQKTGKFLQYVNILRDIQEDLARGRHYVPQETLHKFNLTSLHLTKKNKEKIKACILSFCKKIQNMQKESFLYVRTLPFRFRFPVMVAIHVYTWIYKTIEKNPLSVYTKQIRPSKIRMLFCIIISAIQSL